ncbi:MAG: UvrB/UvrC motif-containing protein [Pirellulaceae bacterium]
MAKRQHIDEILRDWPYEPQSISVRLVKAGKGREVIQMRVEMGLLQIETEGRPDGARPEGYETYFDYLQTLVMGAGRFTLDEEQCNEIDREFVQFYHRRVCWLAMRQYRKAMQDADHTLALMDFCREHSPDEQWTITHEQYRPFVLFHRTQAAALAELEEEENDPEAAVNAINEGLQQLRDVFVRYGVEEDFDEDDLVAKLVELREEMRQKHEVGRTLREQLEDAVAAEQYERAANIRDELARREVGH